MKAELWPLTTGKLHRPKLKQKRRISKARETWPFFVFAFSNFWLMATSNLGESLFEKLSGHYADGTPVGRIPQEYRRSKSIADHLWRMFNTRQGTLPNLPDYGLPDINEVYQKLPSSLKALEQSILNLTTKYEPRLERVRIRALPVATYEFKLSFELSASIRGGNRMVFKTQFSPTGLSTVEALKSRE